jgi:hypothetical protein
VLSVFEITNTARLEHAEPAIDYVLESQSGCGPDVDGFKAALRYVDGNHRVC